MRTLTLFRVIANTAFIHFPPGTQRRFNAQLNGVHLKVGTAESTTCLSRTNVSTSDAVNSAQLSGCVWMFRAICFQVATRFDVGKR